MAIENAILGSLVYNEEYGRKCIPFLKEEYFVSQDQKTVFRIIKEYVDKYNAFPSKEALAIDLSNKDGVGEETFKQSKEIINGLTQDKETQIDWLLDQTEKFCYIKWFYSFQRKEYRPTVPTVQKTPLC